MTEDIFFLLDINNEKSSISVVYNNYRWESLFRFFIIKIHSLVMSNQKRVLSNRNKFLSSVIIIDNEKNFWTLIIVICNQLFSIVFNQKYFSQKKKIIVILWLFSFWYSDYNSCDLLRSTNASRACSSSNFRFIVLEANMQFNYLLLWWKINSPWIIETSLSF